MTRPGPEARPRNRSSRPGEFAGERSGHGHDDQPEDQHRPFGPAPGRDARDYLQLAHALFSVLGLWTYLVVPGPGRMEGWFCEDGTSRACRGRHPKVPMPVESFTVRRHYGAVGLVAGAASGIRPSRRPWAFAAAGPATDSDGYSRGPAEPGWLPSPVPGEGRLSGGAQADEPRSGGGPAGGSASALPGAQDDVPAMGRTPGGGRSRFGIAGHCRAWSPGSPTSSRRIQAGAPRSGTARGHRSWSAARSGAGPGQANDDRLGAVVAELEAAEPVRPLVSRTLATRIS